jgi:hypothetical protein
MFLFALSPTSKCHCFSLALTGVIMKLFAILVIFMVFIGCSPNKYKITNKKAQIVKNSYSSSDTILFQNFILCNNINTLFNNKKLKINEDSVLNIFFASVEKSGVTFVHKNKGSNFCDEEFHKNKLIKVKNISKSKIIEISKPNNTLKAVPFIYINNRSLKHLYFTSKGIPGGGEYLRDTFLNIIIYFIKDNEIIYLKSAWYGPVSSETALPDEAPPKKLEQEHWDKLVELVMRDYIKRMK